MSIDYKRLVASIEQTFINQDKFLFDKHVPEFTYNGQFLGDYFSQLAVEPLGDKPPRFYHTLSPFDVVSKKAPQQAVVFENGELILNIEFDSYVTMRTAAMNVVALKALGVQSLKDKRVLLFGSGKVATQAVTALAELLDLQAVEVITGSNNLTNIKTATQKSNVTITEGSLEKIANYDIIICHTNATASVISEENMGKVKEGAIIHTFITSTEHGELPDSAYNAKQANIIVDWDKTIASAKDLQRAKAAQLFNDTDLTLLKDMLTSKPLNPAKHHTIYRSTGTPIQNLAVLKELI